jgi:hypothetical protein
MSFKTQEEFNQAVLDLEKQYQTHFGQPIPDKIIGWWDPLDWSMEAANKGYRSMKDDVEVAIETNTPISPIPDDLWDTMVF